MGGQGRKPQPIDAEAERFLWAERGHLRLDTLHICVTWERFLPVDQRPG